MTNLVINVPGEYISLGLVMQSALEQASKGKGRERHASEGEVYEDQIICEVARRVGLGYPLGQAVKKIYESQRIGGDAGVQELLGAINYVAAAVIVMREGMEATPKAEGYGYKKGDPVEWFSFRREDAVTGWHPAFYLGKAGDTDYHIVQDADGTWQHVVHCANIRNPKARAECCGDLAKTFAKENPPEASAEPEFKRGDKVQFKEHLGVKEWADARYEREHPSGYGHIVYAEGFGRIAVELENLRPAPKAEGCEELVEKDAPLCGERCEEFIPGLGTCESCRHAREHDAPQTSQELYKRIIDANPATYGSPHKPTGEELAEKTEEAKIMWETRYEDNGNA